MRFHHAVDPLPPLLARRPGPWHRVINLDPMWLRFIRILASVGGGVDAGERIGRRRPGERRAHRAERLLPLRASLERHRLALDQDALDLADQLIAPNQREHPQLGGDPS